MSYTLNRTGAEMDAIFEKSDSVFFATYGSTTNAEITAAINAGKRVYCFDGSKLYAYTNTSGGAHSFSAIGGTTTAPEMRVVTVSANNAWSRASTALSSATLDGIVYQDSNGYLFVSD